MEWRLELITLSNTAPLLLAIVLYHNVGIHTTYQQRRKDKQPDDLRTEQLEQ